MHTKESLHLTINNYCNNNCLFCLERKDVKYLHIPSLKETSVILKNARRNTDSVLFTGPEPTVNPSLVSYIKLAKKIGYKEVRLVTNGRRLSYFNFTRELLNSGLTDILVSLHGSKKSIHGALTRTPYSFDQTVKACQILSFLKSHYPFRWEINITLNKINAPDLCDFFKLASSFNGVDCIGVNAVIPRGRAIQYFNSLITNYTDLANAFKSAIARIQGENNLKAERIFNIGIVGLPLCLFKNFEQYVGGFERILMKINSPNKKIEVQEMSRPKRLKGKTCKRCKYFILCEGVWSEYIKRRGWLEFQPVL